MGCSYHLPVLPLLLVGDESSLDEDVVREDVHDGIIAGVDIGAHFLAAADDMVGSER